MQWSVTTSKLNTFNRDAEKLQLATFDKLHAVTQKRRPSPAVWGWAPIGRCIINHTRCLVVAFRKELISHGSACLFTRPAVWIAIWWTMHTARYRRPPCDAHSWPCCTLPPCGARVSRGLRNAESCHRVTCRKSSVEHSTNYPLSHSAVENPAVPQIAKLLLARIVQQMCNWCIAASGVPRSLPSIFFVMYLPKNSIFYNLD